MDLISYADLPGFGFRRRNLRFKEEMEMRTSSMWPWLARMGIKVGHTRPSCQEMESSCGIAYNWHDIVGGEEASLAEGSAVEKLFVIVIDRGSGASERLVS